MYHPYFRGKQFELITVREMAPLMAMAKFHPIIEPVRETVAGLEKALDALVFAGANATVVVNPYYGDFSNSGEPLTNLLRKRIDCPNISAGILLTQSIKLAEAVRLYDEHRTHNPVIIHAGFTEPRKLAEKLGSQTKDQKHVFFEDLCGKLYQKHFRETQRILLRDGFKRKRNADYDEVESFSDLHVTFNEEGVDGFGDFLIVGDDFSEAGGPAYAIAIHLTFIDSSQEDLMFIYHFVSERQNTPLDPAGKFAEALARMIRKIDSPNSGVFETSAVEEFRKLHREGHFPGLGYIKKLSMNHHIETLARFFGTEWQ
jgi:hypothetical protein